MFKALVVSEDSKCSSEVREALADAGCVDIEVATLEVALAAHLAVDTVIVDLARSNIACVSRLAKQHDVPVVALCEERYIDAALRAGAAECATTPVRTRELAGRIRHAMRARNNLRASASRERRMSEQIVALEREKEQLERLVCVDGLTGLANRRHALSLLAAEWRRASREHQPIGVIMIDLDCYHAFNEQYGHLGGDACLRHVCEAMVKCLRRPSDFLGRYGGEEFIAVLPNTDSVGAKIVAERLRAAVEALQIPHAASACARVVTITAGFVSLHVTPDLTMDRLVAVSDAALLRAKAAGRNRVEGDAPLVRPSRVSAQRWQRYAPVVADPWFVDRIPAFLEDVRIAARQDMTSTEQLRTTARSMGMPIVERLLLDHERATHTGDIAAAREAADELVQYVTHVQVIYRRPSDELAA